MAKERAFGLGDRMKEYYENRSKTYLTRRTPVIIRIDGKAFHTFTRRFKRPYDPVFMKSMEETTLDLCNGIMGCVMGYTQSDEITLVLVDYKNIDSDAWFDYSVQKLCSVSASMATLFFNRRFAENANDYINKNAHKIGKQDLFGLVAIEAETRILAYQGAMKTGACFDSRCFNVPVDEVTNCILWRQQDASRNSILMLGQSTFSHKELMNKSCSNIQDMLMEKYNINWNDYSIPQKRGTAVIREGEGWKIDHEMPILTGENRNYVENLIKPNEEQK